MRRRQAHHIRWLAYHLVRDEHGRLTIPEHARAQVEDTVLRTLDDPERADELLDQILSLAQGALREGGEVELARALVLLVLAHPRGRARLEQGRAGLEWLQFAAEPVERRAPKHDLPAPEDSVSLGALYNKRRKRLTGR